MSINNLLACGLVRRQDPVRLAICNVDDFNQFIECFCPADLQDESLSELCDFLFVKLVEPISDTFRSQGALDTNTGSGIKALHEFSVRLGLLSRADYLSKLLPITELKHLGQYLVAEDLLRRIGSSVQAARSLTSGGDTLPEYMEDKLEQWLRDFRLSVGDKPSSRSYRTLRDNLLLVLGASLGIVESLKEREDWFTDKNAAAFEELLGRYVDVVRGF